MASKKNHKQYNTTTRSNGKYIRLTEVLDLINTNQSEDKKLSRETLLARIRRYESETGDIITTQDPSPSPDKSPILVDYDKLKTNIPSLQESDTIKDLIAKVQNLEEQVRIIYEVFYTRGFLRRNL